VKRHVTFALAGAISSISRGAVSLGIIGLASTALVVAPAAAQTPPSGAAAGAASVIDAHLAAAKKAAGFDFPGLVSALCIAPRNAPTRDVPPGPPPANRASQYTPPAKVFDDVYFVGTKDRSAWVLTTPEGIILIDTTFEYETEDVIVGGLKKLGFDPASVKYVVITHAHPGEVGGAKLMQDRFGSRIVIGAGDWETIEKSVNLFPNGKPKRDIAVTEVQNITLGGRTVTVVPMPGHTPGTLSLIFQVKDNGTPLTVAFSGGTEFNFVNDVPHFDTYIASARKFAAAADAAGATVLLTNQSEFDAAASKIRMLADRRPGERHPLEVGRDGVARYFKIFDECAQVARLKLL
jgi:metallo-beta-lactamase class B